MIEQNKLLAQYERELNNILQGEASFSSTTRALYATAACMYKIVPAGVVYPKSTADVASVIVYARDHKLSVTARGAGSSLVGQAVNKGIILDFSRYMNKIIEYDSTTETVRVQPGVVYGALNHYLEEYDRYFPPDPSSGAYCTVGGMVANNAAGAHSIKNGFTIDYIESLQVVLHDGQIIQTKEWDTESTEFKTFLQEQSEHSKLSARVDRLITENEELIQRYTPKVQKNTSGYRLEQVRRDGTFNLGKLLCGSEGTLGLITEITLRVKKPPLKKYLTVINFNKLEDATDAIESILSIGPSAVEMMEKKAMELVRSYHPDLHDFYPEGIQSQLYVEFDGDSDSILNAQQNKLIHLLKDRFTEDVTYKTVRDQKEQAKLWKIRKASFPLVYQQKRPEKVPAFIEDFVLPPKHIARFIRLLYSIYEKHNTEAMILGHAGNGNFHTRPYVDFSKTSELQKMQQIAQEVTDKVLEMGGAISGEHGDGRARAHLLIQQAGPLYEVYEQIKQIFDPDGLLNPDVKISRKNQLTSNLRFDPEYRRASEETLLHFESDDYFYEVEKCHGCSACRQTNLTNTMCPLFQITGEELAAPRGKANILQNLISGDLDAAFIDQDDYKKMLDYCIYCEGCYVECDSHVDVGRLLLEHKARYRAKHGADRLQKMLENSEWMSKAQSWLAPLANPLMSTKPARFLIEKALGVDRRRPLPKAEPVWRFHANNKSKQVDNPIGKVVFFHDLYARYNNSELSALAIQILNALQIQVETVPLASAAMPAVVYGNLALARKTISKSVPMLVKYIRQGYKIISTEPTAVLALQKEWQDVLPSQEVKLVAGNTFEFFDYLIKMFKNREILFNFRAVKQTYGYHAPCHLKALRIGSPGVELLRQIPGVQINEIDRGCCGIAGTYGFKKGENGYEQSMKIGAALFEELKKPENSLGLSECSTCRMQMEHGAQKQVMHPVQVLAEAMGIY